MVYITKYLFNDLLFKMYFMKQVHNMYNFNITIR